MQYAVQDGSCPHSIEVASLTAGIYLYSLNNGTSQLHKRMVKVNERLIYFDALSNSFIQLMTLPEG